MTQLSEKEAFSARLNEVLDDLGFPAKFDGRQTELAKRFHVTQKGARKWLEGLSIPSFETCVGIARWANVHFEWLMTGRGPKSVDPSVEASPPAMPPEMRQEAFDFLEFKGRKFYSGDTLAAYLRWLDRIILKGPPGSS